MTRTLCTFLALLLAAVPLQAQAPTPLTLPSAYTWDQAAPSLAVAQSYTYRLYKDGQSPGINLTGVVCTLGTSTTPAGSFACEAPFLTEIPGIAHSIQLTARLGTGTESGPSNPYAYIIVAPVAPAASPKNLRKK